jgi:type VII secretion-associated serine protease mycosin
LSIALCALATAPVLATVSVLTATPALAASKLTPSSPGGGSGSGAVGFVSLPTPTSQCTGQGGSGTAARQAPTPWAQQVLDYSSAWKFTQGSGVVVAVIDSGVDANSQLGKRVYVGPTFAAAPSGLPYSDCVGHGTMVAGIIAADAPNSGFSGVAPQATILSLKVTNSDTYNGNSVIEAVDAAVAYHVGVIEISSTVSPSPALESAVENAIANNVVVVASAGNDPQDTNGNIIREGPYYPAEYPGVLSVGAIDQTGELANFSSTKTRVDVAAPGVNITSTYPGSSGTSYYTGDGTSFAAPFVAGVAALVRARYPQLKAPQVVRLIDGTADGSAGPGTGHGLVNPVQALTAVQPESLASPSGKAGAVIIDRAVPNRSEKIVAISVAGGAFGLAALMIAAAVVIPAGRRRRWRPGEFS